MLTAFIPEEDRLFLADQNKIVIARLDGTERKVLIEHQNTKDLNGIVVDPVAR